MLPPGLLDLMRGLPGYQQLERELSDGHAPSAASLLDAAKPVLLATLWRSGGTRSAPCAAPGRETRRPIFVVTARPEQARVIHEQVAACTGERLELALLPEPDALPFERLVSDRTTIHQRLTVLARMAGLLEGPPYLVIASAYAAAAKTLTPGELRERTVRIRRGGRVELMDLLRRLAALGYRTEAAVEVPGTVSRRGGILDIFPPTLARPVRIDLFGDTVESLRVFDPESQRSLDDLAEVVVPPADESLPPGPASKPPRLDVAACNPDAQAEYAEALRRLAAGEWFDDIERYRGLLNSGCALDYLPPEGVLVWDQPQNIVQTLDEIDAEGKELRDRLAHAGSLPPDLPPPHLGSSALNERAGQHQRRLALSAFSGEAPTLPFAVAPSYAGRTRIFLDELRQLREAGQATILVSQQAPRLAELLQEIGVMAAPSIQLTSVPTPKGVALVHGSLAEGWSLPDHGLVLLTDAELFGITKQRRIVRRRPIQRQPFLAELSPGDYVVHIDHGVARFAGTLLRQSGDREREYLVLEYAGGDRLLVPSEQIDRVGPYVGASDRPPGLTRLGTQEWHRLKERVKASTVQVARELLALYASREVVQGHAFGPDAPWQAELEASFPYVETPDQLRAITDTKGDMEKAKPMDRLITGDVGYGKTEVALRAAFKAVMGGKQVAILVPTTVLALQHYNTFSQRLAAFPVKVEMLSRFRSPKDQDAVVAGLAGGTVDICIGTHRLLQKDVAFKDLGLVVIDEEQRFGVAHKERLKQLRREVDVLSMSATPIPRTLYMALAGVRDMSIMETPPEERLPIKTYVAPMDDAVCREAILRELERGGQVFLVHNRVFNIGLVAERVRRLVPEARIAIAHGQMPEELLERVMLEFAEGKADVLVCTTIIESGLDMPNVNTLIVDDANRYGLAQLYQLRGRVGRGATRAYAYFFYEPGHRLTEVAEKRLKTILSATELGAGFKIAMKDLEIRGAGNLLGTEQHGHISAVGFDLYVRLLADAVAELKAGVSGESPPAPKLPQPAIDLPLAAHVPEPYIPDLATRLGIYQRMARLEEPTDVDILAEEMKDRFGPWPEPVENLLFMLKVKLLAAKAGVLSVSHETGEVVLAGDEKTWSALLGVQRPYGDGVRIGHTRVRLDIRRLGNRWRTVLEKLLAQTGKAKPEAALTGR